VPEKRENLHHKAIKTNKTSTTPGQKNVRMALPLGGNVRRQAIFWTGTLIFFILLLVVFSEIMLPFVAGLALAYFLNPVVAFFEKIGISRLWVTLAIVLIMVILLVLVLMVLVPVLIQQLAGFIRVIPGYVARIQALVNSHDFDWLKQYGIDLSSFQGNLDLIISRAVGLLQSLLPSLWSSGKAIMNMVTLLVVAPVVAFYMLLDWNRMVLCVDSWIPRDHLETVRGIFRQMDRAVAGFIRGQGTVCIILGIYYAVTLTITGLNFGLLIGLFMGLITFIPYAGSAVGLILAVGLAWIQYWPDDWTWIVGVAIVFLVGQFLEGYILQPKLVGSSVGLHPVWLMFAMFAFGVLFGFTGLLLAVPAAAAVGVLVRFALHSYLDSPLYRRQEGEEEKASQ